MAATSAEPFHAWMRAIAASGSFDQLADRFQDARALRRSSAWHEYLDAVYGAETLSFPLSLTQLHYFHWDRLRDDVRAQLTLKAHPYWSSIKLPQGQQLEFGDLYSTRPLSSSYYRKHHWDVWRSFRPCNGCDGAGSLVSRGVASGGLIEVAHLCCDADEAYALAGRPPDGFWMYMQPGSGVFLNVGRTHVTLNHSTVVAELAQLGCSHKLLREHNVSSTHLPEWQLSYPCARVLGFDTLQFTHQHEEGLTRYEVLLVKDLMPQTSSSGRGGCPGTGFERAFFTGWDGRRPCTCDPRSLKLACLETAARTSPPPPPAPLPPPYASTAAGRAVA